MSGKVKQNAETKLLNLRGGLRNVELKIGRRMISIFTFGIEY